MTKTADSIALIYLILITVGFGTKDKDKISKPRKIQPKNKKKVIFRFHILAFSSSVIELLIHLLKLKVSLMSSVTSTQVAKMPSILAELYSSKLTGIQKQGFPFKNP